MIHEPPKSAPRRDFIKTSSSLLVAGGSGGRQLGLNIARAAHAFGSDDDHSRPGRLRRPRHRRGGPGDEHRAAAR